MLMRIPALSGVMRSSGAEYLGISKSGEIAILKAGDWDESKHKRAENGQFGSGSGKGKESAGAKHKRNQQARRAESAGQSTLGGKAIQTLLSGGSALDKIGWLNTSKPKEQEKPALPYQGLLDQPLPNDHYKLIDLYDKIKDTDERPVKGFEFPHDDPRYTKLKEIRAKIREIDNGASARNMAAQQEMDVMEGGREFENPSAYRSWAPPKYKAPRKPSKPEPKAFPANPKPGDEFRNEYDTVFVADAHGRWQNAPLGYTPKDHPPKQSSPAEESSAPRAKEPHKPAEQPAPKSTPPKPGNPGNGSPATFEDMFGSLPDHIKVEGSIDYTKPYVLRISGKTFNHRENLKALGFKWGDKSKTWYKGIEPKEGKDAKAELLEHIKGVSSGSGAPTQLKATMTQGKLVPKGQGTPAAAPGVKTPAKPATAPRPFPSNPNDGKPGTVPAHELGSLLSDIVEMEDEIVRHEARRDWEPEVKLSAPIPELKRKIEEARAKYKESADRLTPAARYEVLSEHNYNKIKRGRRSGPSKELRELGEKGGLYKK